MVDTLLITLGSRGCELWIDNTQTIIHAIKTDKIVDPTGCGDVFRAGLLHALNLNFSWQIAIQLGCVVAGIKVSHNGAQNHHLSWKNIEQLYEKFYREDLPKGLIM